MKNEETTEQKPEKILKSVDENVKKRKKRRKPKTAATQNNGPPLNVDDFSSNWKKFLTNQPKPVPKEKKEAKTTKDSSSKEGTHGDNKSVNRKRKRSENKKPEKSEVSGKPNDIWFDVDPALLKKTKRQGNNNNNNDKNDNTNKDNIKEETDDEDDDEKEANETTTADNTPTEEVTEGKLTKYLAIDCEMVGVGFKGDESVLARVSIVNSRCECVYDKFVKSVEKVVDYRTHVSGVRPSDMERGTDFETVQREVSEMLKGRYEYLVNY